MTNNRTLGDLLFQGTDTQVLGTNSTPSPAWSTAWLPVPQGRLSCNSAQPVDPAGAGTARTAIYYLPYVGNQIPVWDGTAWTRQIIPDAGLTLNLESNASNTGYHQSGKNFDLFVINNAGTLTLASGPSWTSDTVRANALANTAGIKTNSNTQTMRIGTGTANSLSVTANYGTYVGTFYTSAAGQTKMWVGGGLSGASDAANASYFYVWNMYNRRQVVSEIADGAAAHLDSTQAWRQYGNGSVGTGMTCNFTVGLNEDAVFASISGTATANGAGFTAGLDSQTDAGASFYGTYIFTYSQALVGAAFKVPPTSGKHYITMQEFVSSASPANISTGYLVVGVWA